MNDKDTNVAAIAVSIWFVAYHAGMFIAAEINRPVGFVLMAFATILLALYLWAKDRIDAERKRWKRYAEDCAKRAREAHEEWLRR